MQKFRNSLVAVLAWHLILGVCGLSLVSCSSAPMNSTTGFVLVDQAQIPVPPPPDRYSYLALAYGGPSSKGGILAAGRQGNTRAWAFYVSGDMRLEWSRITDQGWPAHGAMVIADARDGGFWVVGNGQSKDTGAEAGKSRDPSDWQKILGAVRFEYLAHFDKSGTPIWQRPVFTGAAHWIQCVKEGPDGLFMLGIDAIPVIFDGRAKPKGNLAVPWVAKTDKEGKLLWERRIGGGDSPVLIPKLDSQPGCTLVADGGGGVTLGVAVAQLDNVVGTDTMHGPDRYESQATEKGALIARFDSAGKQLQSIRLDAGDKTFLFATERGFSVVDHIRPTPDPALLKNPSILGMLTEVRRLVGHSGVRITNLSDNLEKVDERTIEIPSLSNRLTAVLPLDGGDYLMAGCSDLSSANTILWVSATGVATPIKTVSANQCAVMAIGRANTDDDFLLFLGQGAPGYRIFKFHRVIESKR